MPIMHNRVIDDAEAYDREYSAFLRQLDEFHQQKATTFKRVPKINGKEIDLYLLYVLVTARGGWQKVNSRNEWDDILDDFRLPSACVNSATALKHIYIRYLDLYERVNYLGDDCDERSNDQDEDESRSLRQRRAIRAVNIVPLIYNHQIHNVSETTRVSCGMSPTLYEPSIYDRLALSLSCPLPNEHDFAFNICTLLSNEGKHTLQLSQCPRLLEFMLSHTGVFKDGETQRYFVSNYKNAKDKSLVQFWIDSVQEKSVLDLLNTEYFKECQHSINLMGIFSEHEGKEDIHLPFLEHKNVLQSSSNFCNHSIASFENSSESRSLDGKGLTAPVNPQSCNSFSKYDFKELFKCDVGDVEFTAGDEDIFHLGRDLGLLDSEGTRISQVLHILRNLSFEDSNIPILAQSDTCLRFLLLCVYSRWGGLSVGALDTLGNIATDVLIRDPVSDPTSSVLLSMVCQGVSSSDRAVVLRCLEVLNKLALNELNDELMSNTIDQEVYNRICRFLSVHDIMLLIYTLEALYSLSSLGHSSCNCIARSKGCVQILISLLTVEAQSYGPEACVGMKVVETVTGVVNDSDSSSRVESGNTSPITAVTVSTTLGSLPCTSSSSPNSLSSSSTANVIASGVVTNHSISTVQFTHSSSGASVTNPKIVLNKTLEIPPKRVVPLEVEEFVTNWVSKNYDACASNAIEQAIVYRHFAASMHSLGRKQGLNPVLLSNCVRKVFGTTVGPCRKQVEDGTEKWHYHGIKRKTSKTVPSMSTSKHADFCNLKLTPTSFVAVSTCSSNLLVSQANSGSILKAHLSAPLRNCPSPIKGSPQEIAGDVFISSSGTDQSISSRLVSSPQVPRTDNSSLIKSLLVNKISRAIPKIENKVISEHHTDEIVSNDLPSFNGILNEMNRSESMESSASNKKIITFEGILQNGDQDTSNAMRSNKRDNSKKNLLADLLEKTVGGDILNDVVEKDRSSEKVSLPSFSQFARGNNLTPNGNMECVNQSDKRAATPDTYSVKRMAMEDPYVDDEGSIYLSQNGNEMQTMKRSSHASTSEVTQGLVSVSQVSSLSSITPLCPQQVIIQRPSSQGTILLQSQENSNHILSSKLQQSTHVSSHSQIQSNLSQNIFLGTLSSGSAIGENKVMSSQGSSTFSANGNQVIQLGQGNQKVILQGSQLGQILTGQVILPQANQSIIMPSTNDLQGQVVMQSVSSNNQTPFIVQSSASHGQVFVQSGSGNSNPVVMQSNSGHGQFVVSAGNQTQNSNGQTMLLPGAHPQIVMTGGQSGQSGQHVLVGSSSPNQVIIPGGNVSNAVFLSQHAQGSQKTVIILPNPKVVGTSSSGLQTQHSPPVVLSRQMIQVVSSPNAQSISPGRITISTSHSVDGGSSTNSPYGSVTVNVTTANAAITSAPSAPKATPVLQISSSSSSIPHIPAPQVLASGIVRRPKVSTTGLQFLCEWRGCNQEFSTPGQVYHHACKVHCPPHVSELTCQWTGCDPMVRKRFSTMTHIHDRHCNEQLLQVLALRRRQISTVGKTEIPIPQALPHHPGYAPNAAYHAIKRHSLEVINHRDTVDKEGPVTKSIRLTAALILRNLVIYSTSGKALLKGFEAELSNVAISHMEASRTVSQILYDVNPREDQAL